MQVNDHEADSRVQDSRAQFDLSSLDRMSEAALVNEEWWVGDSSFGEAMIESGGRQQS